MVFPDTLILTQAPHIQGGSASWYPREVPRGFTLASFLHAGDDLVVEYVPAGPTTLDLAPGGLSVTRSQRAPYRSLALLAAELGVPGLEPLVPLATASRLFMTGQRGFSAGTARSFSLSPDAFPGTLSPYAKQPDTKQPDTNQSAVNQPAVNQPECRQLVFTSPGKVGLRTLRLEPAPDELVVESRLMGIS
ncbi:MAG: hypothetical protein ABIJ86_09955, partial [Spirochaetota bacterium]